MLADPSVDLERRSPCKILTLRRLVVRCRAFLRDCEALAVPVAEELLPVRQRLPLRLPARQQRMSAVPVPQQ